MLHVLFHGHLHSSELLVEKLTAVLKRYFLSAIYRDTIQIWEYFLPLRIPRLRPNDKVVGFCYKTSSEKYIFIYKFDEEIQYCFSDAKGVIY